MGPPSYTALSVEHAPWSHTQRHPGSPTALHAPTRIAARSMPTNGANRQRDCTTRTLVPRSRGRQPSRQGWLGSATRAHRSTTPLPRAITGFDPLYRPSGAQLWAAPRAPSPRRHPHTPAPEGHPTALSPRHRSHTARCNTPRRITSPMREGDPRTHTRYMHSGGQGRLSAAPHLTLGKATCASSSA